MRLTMVSSTLSFALFIAIPFLSFAESTQWSSTETVRFNFPGGSVIDAATGKARFSPKAGASWIWMQNPSITVTYRANVTDEAGTLIPCGSSVPKGTRLRFDFDQHSYQDAHWFATGGGYDSPYGDWIADAAPPPIQCVEKDKATDDKNARYIAFSVAPPQKEIQGLDSLSCTGDGADKICTTDSAGTINADFVFRPTFGHFYFRIYDTNTRGGSALCTGGTSVMGINVGQRSCTTKPGLPPGCGGSQKPMIITKGKTTENTGEKNAYVVRVPERVISCPITVTDTPIENNPPRLNSLDAVGECVVGESHTVTMTSSDDDSDAQLKYYIDWGNPDANGIWASSSIWDISNWMNPGSYTPSPGRTYATVGTKTVTVKVVDNHGASSEEKTVSFTCAENPSAEASFCDGAASCGTIGDDGSGGGTVPTNPPANISIRAVPSLVKSGRTTKINWSAENVQSCTTTAPNGDSWNTTSSQVGGEVSSVIVGDILYTLSCIDLDGDTQTKTAKVRILPSFKEL